VDVLRGVGALFQASERPMHAQFHSYVASLALRKRYPGITNLSFSEYVAPPGPALPAGVERGGYHVLTYLEAMESDNGLFGYDIGSNPALAKTLADARDHGQIAATG